MLVRKTAILDRFEGKKAVLILENNQELVLLKEDLGKAKEGDVFSLQILPEKEATLKREQLARTLLNQILNDQEGPSSEEVTKKSS